MYSHYGCQCLLVVLCFMVSVYADIKSDVHTIQKQVGGVEKVLVAVKSQLTSVISSLGAKCSPRVRYPRDCADIMARGVKTSGVYTVYLGIKRRPVKVYCDMTTDGGGWLVFQRRKDGSVNFYRKWTHYANGFGNLRGEFWLGNDYLHKLTWTDERYEMRVDLADFSGNRRYAKYSNFKVASAVGNYRLVSVGVYSGNAGNGFKGHKGHMFSTLDADHDTWSKSCAVTFRGAWWYTSCHQSNLNGAYFHRKHISNGDGLNWYPWRGDNYSLKFTEMKIRPSYY